MVKILWQLRTRQLGFGLPEILSECIPDLLRNQNHNKIWTYRNLSMTYEYHNERTVCFFCNPRLFAILLWIHQSLDNDSFEVNKIACRKLMTRSVCSLPTSVALTWGRHHSAQTSMTPNPLDYPCVTICDHDLISMDKVSMPKSWRKRIHAKPLHRGSTLTTVPIGNTLKTFLILE